MVNFTEMPAELQFMVAEGLIQDQIDPEHVSFADEIYHQRQYQKLWKSISGFKCCKKLKEIGDLALCRVINGDKKLVHLRAWSRNLKFEPTNWESMEKCAIFTKNVVLAPQIHSFSYHAARHLECRLQQERNNRSIRDLQTLANSPCQGCSGYLPEFFVDMFLAEQMIRKTPNLDKIIFERGGKSSQITFSSTASLSLHWQAFLYLAGICSENGRNTITSMKLSDISDRFWCVPQSWKNRVQVLDNREGAFKTMQGLKKLELSVAEEPARLGGGFTIKQGCENLQVPDGRSTWHSFLSGARNLQSLSLKQSFGTSHRIQLLNHLLSDYTWPHLRHVTFKHVYLYPQVLSNLFGFLDRHASTLESVCFDSCLLTGSDVFSLLAPASWKSLVDQIKGYGFARVRIGGRFSPLACLDHGRNIAPIYGSVVNEGPLADAAEQAFILDESALFERAGFEDAFGGFMKTKSAVDGI